MIGGSIFGGGTQQRTSQYTIQPWMTPEMISKYFGAAYGAASGLPWEELMEGDWERLEKVLYEKPAGRLREEMGQMEPRLYSQMSLRGIGDAPEVVAKNVGEAMIPFSRRFADIASEATASRYGLQAQSMLEKNLGLERRMGLWYGGFRPTGATKTHGFGKSFNLSGQGNVGWEME